VRSGRVEFQNVTRICEPSKYRALDGVSAQFEAGRIHAVLGENGAGKSTLMKILFGLVRPSGGTVYVDGAAVKFSSPTDAIRAGLGMVQQHFSLVDTLSVIDNIMLGHEAVQPGGRLDRAKAIKELEAALPSEDLRLDWHRMVGELSIGEQQRVEILKLIARKAQILVLDEPTAVLSPREIESLFSVLKDLKAHGRTIFVITHKLSEVFDHCDTWMVLRAGKFVGSGEIATTTRSEIVRAMVGADVPPLGERAHVEVNRSEPSIRVSNLTAQAKAVKLDGLSFEVRPGEIVGIAGVDGSGQTELVNTLIGLQDFSGEVQVLGNVLDGAADEANASAMLRGLLSSGLALVSEDRHHQGLWMDQSVWMNANLGYKDEHWLNLSQWELDAQRFSREYDVRAPGLNTEVRNLSGGNQQKLIFAREMMSRPVKLLVAHQPTRGVDLAAVQLIHRKILAARAAGAAVLVISSELDELFALADRLLVMAGGKISGEFDREGQEGFDRNRVGDAMILGKKVST
jgi:general nucleoside transport system ATP-binding protein